MSLSVGSVAALEIEKPAAGGRMIARVDGQVVLVAGAIPGERVRARVSRVGKGVAYADATAIDEPSTDRREPFVDPACGGCTYAYIAYARQLQLKGEIVADAFGRIGRVALPAPPIVRPSPEEGYRMRARLHVSAGSTSASFFREGTHDLCAARATRQLLPATCDVIDALLAQWHAAMPDLHEIEVSENIDASERVVHLDMTSHDPSRFRSLVPPDGISGISMAVGGRGALAERRLDSVHGDPIVRDTVTIDGTAIHLQRHVLAFFQGNRYLLGDLMTHVIQAIDTSGPVVDLYAGVGGFAVGAAIVRNLPVVAVEGDWFAARDLADNAKRAEGTVETLCQPVEEFLARTRTPPATLIVDPPRVGMSKEAMAGVIRLRAAQVIYVSCDVATLARDARRLLEAGYELAQVSAFDLFPHTPHVETVAQFRLR